MAGILSAALFTGACNEGAGGTAADETAGTGRPCFEDTPELLPPGNPDFVGVISGETMANATLVVSANIARAANDASCCQDFVVAGRTPQVRVKFAAPSDGLTFLASRSDESVKIGSGGPSPQSALDLAVADLNGDNRNDIVVLRNDKIVVIALAVSNPPSRGPYFGAVSTLTMSVGAVVPGTSLGVGDVDGDGDLDIAVTSTTNRVLWRRNNGDGTFAAAISSAAGLSTQNLVLAQVDADNRADVLVSGDDGRFAYLRSTGAALAAPVLHRVFPDWPAPGALIAAGRFCPGNPTAMAVAMAEFDRVAVACSDGSGEFVDVVEPHGTQLPGNGVVADYEWKYAQGSPSSFFFDDLAVWTPDAGVSELYALEKGDTVYRNVPGACEYNSGPNVPLAKWGSGSFSAMTVHREAQGDETWGAISCAGTFGLLSVH